MRLTDTRGQRRVCQQSLLQKRERKEVVGERYLDEVLPLLLACADRFLNASQLTKDGLGLIQLVVCLTAGHFPVNPEKQNDTLQRLQGYRNHMFLYMCYVCYTLIPLIIIITGIYPKRFNPP